MKHANAEHVAAFLTSGAIAFASDAIVLTVLTELLGIDPYLARIAAISLAMVAGWLSHRRWTFRATTPPSVPEFLRYAGVAWGVALLNYAVYVAILLSTDQFPPLGAMTVSSLVAMFASYAGMRFAVFRPR